MSPRLVIAVTCASLVWSVSTGGPALAAEEPTAPDQKLSATWTVTDGDKPAWAEKLKLVIKPDGRWFASATLTPPKAKDKAERKKRIADGPYPLGFVLQRDGGGRLSKYFREEDKRKGQGLRAFRRQDLIRIVGVNTGRKDATEIPGVDHVVWDPTMWSTLWGWLHHVPKTGDAAEVGFLDVAKRKAGRATLKRVGKRVVTNKAGVGAEVHVWQISGVGVAGLELLLDARNRMVGARAGSRALLLAGWSWAAPATVGAGEADVDAETKDKDAPPVSDEDDGGVGP